MKKSAQVREAIHPEKLPEEKVQELEQSELLDDKGVMEWLKIKRTQLYMLMHRSYDPLPYVRLLKRSLRFRRCAVAKWLERQEDRAMGRSSSGGEKADGQGTIRAIRKKTR